MREVFVRFPAIVAFEALIYAFRILHEKAKSSYSVSVHKVVPGNGGPPENTIVT